MRNVDVKLIRPDAATTRFDKEELTDIDVLGIKFLPENRLLKIAADCTTRKRGVVMNRTFVLRGIMDLVGAEEGFVLLDPGRPLPQDHRTASKAIKITLLDPNDANFLLKRLNMAEPGVEESNLFKEGSHIYLEKNLSNILKEFLNAITYRKLGYWQDPINEQLLNSIFNIKDIASKMNIKEQKFHLVLAYEYFFLFVMAALSLAWHMASTSSPNNLDNLDIQLRYFLYGGEKHYKSRIRMMEFLEEKLGAGTKNARNGDLYVAPPEWKRFLDVYTRLLLNPLESIHIPQVLRLALFEKVLYKNAEMYSQSLPIQANDITFKLIGDLARYYALATGLPGDFAKSVETFVAPSANQKKTLDKVTALKDNAPRSDHEDINRDRDDVVNQDQSVGTSIAESVKMEEAEPVPAKENNSAGTIKGQKDLEKTEASQG